MRAKLPINPYIINLSLDFLKDRQQRVMHNTFKGSWRTVNLGTGQATVSGPHLFKIFLNDLEISRDNCTFLYQYKDDSAIIAHVVRSGGQVSDQLYNLQSNKVQRTHLSQEGFENRSFLSTYCRHTTMQKNCKSLERISRKTHILLTTSRRCLKDSMF